MSRSRTNYTDDEKKAFVKAWMASRMPKSRWHKEQVEAGNIEGHYNAFDQWVKLWQNELFDEAPAQPSTAPAGGQEMGKHFRSAYKAGTQSVMGGVGKNPSLLAEFQQTLLPDDVQAKYIAFLEAKVSGLTNELEALQEENAQLHTRLEALEAPEAQQENE